MFKHWSFPALLLPLHFSRISVNPSWSVKWDTNPVLFTSPVIMMKCLIVTKLLFVHETGLVVTLECVSSLPKCNNLGKKKASFQKKFIKNTILTSYYKNLKLWTCNTEGSVCGLNWPPIPSYRREELNVINEKVLLFLWYTNKLMGDNEQQWVELEQKCPW